jgi:transcriptional regulator with XRE-family HTH domain
MQAESIAADFYPYHEDMATAGRPPRRDVSDFAARLRALRRAASLTQQQMAEQLGISQPSYALWERNDVALKPDQLARLAEILAVDVGDLVSPADLAHRRGGPSGRARKAFEVVSRLPRSQQQRILGVVEDLLAAQRVNGRRKESES